MWFRDIKPFQGWGNYQADVPLRYIPQKIRELQEESGLDMDPDFQRAHVWTPTQQTRFMEFILRRGRTGRELLFNSASWMGDFKKDMVLVDGKQRLHSILGFFDNKVPIFDGLYFKDFTDKIDAMLTMRFYVNTLQTRAEILQWYLDLNAGGTIHTDMEIRKVEALLRLEKGT